MKEPMSNYPVLSRRRMLLGATAAAGAIAVPSLSAAQTRIDVTQGTVKPMPIALPDFVGGAGAADSEIGRGVAQIIAGTVAIIVALRR